MYRLALLLTVIALVPTHSATTDSFSPSLANQERKLMAECTWPMDPHTFSSRFTSRQSTIVKNDTSTLIGLSLFLLLGTAVLYSDLCDLCEEESSTEVAKTSPEKRQGAHERGHADSRLFKAGVASAIASVAFLQILPVNQEASFCLRVPLHSHGMPVIPFMTEGALKELLSLMPVKTSAASDEMTMLALGFFVLFGLLIACIDFCTFVAELDAAEETEKSKALESKALMTESDKPQKAKTWSQYLTNHWRMVSCVVLLYAMFCAAVASMWEQAI